MFEKLYRTVRILSLDIVAGVGAGSIFAARIMEIRLPWTYLTVMCLTVWLIYLTDHLLDGIKKKSSSSHSLHGIFYRYKIPLILFLLIAVIFDFRLSLYTLPPSIIQFGLIIGGATVLYLSLAFFSGRGNSVFFMKELWISVIYTMAVWGGPVIYSGNTMQTWQIIVMTSYGLLVLSNVLSYSYFEYNADRSGQERSFAVDFGLSRTRILIYILLGAAIAACLGNLLVFEQPMSLSSMIIGFMALCLFILIRFPSYFRNYGLYGIYADALFLLPILVVTAG